MSIEDRERLYTVKFKRESEIGKGIIPRAVYEVEPFERFPIPENTESEEECYITIREVPIYSDSAKLDIDALLDETTESVNGKDIVDWSVMRRVVEMAKE